MTLGPVSSISEMNRELQIRCNSAGLAYDCGCGGLLNAETAIVAEAPGDRECALKEPLVGGSGKLLFECLRKQGITRNHVYITNVVKRRLVSQGDHGGKPKAPIGRNEIDHWVSILQEELVLLPAVRYVVCLGSFALDALIGADSITNWRGSVVATHLNDGRLIKALIVNNPAVIFHDPKTEIVFRMDIDKLQRLINGTFRKPEFIERINPTVDEALDYIRHCREIGIAGTPISMDIETLGGETACVGLAASNVEGLCINWRTQRDNRYSRNEEREVRLALHSLLSDRRIKFITQNGNFDASWLWYKDRIRLHGTWLDTMLAHHVLYPTLPHNLGFLTAQYTDHPYYKDDGKDWKEGGDIDQFWRYNVKDCCITRIVALRILDELRDQHLDEFYFSHVARLTPHLTEMTMNGIAVDRSLKDELNESLGRDVAQKRDEFLAAAREALGDHEYSCNPLSPPDLRDLFFNRLKLVGRGASTDEDNRRRMLSHPRTSDRAKRVLHLLDQYKEAHKFHSTYVGCAVDEDGRFRCEWKQTGVQTAPGRLSSSKTKWDTGMNLQNQTEKSKAMFIADEGYEFSYFDMAQIEARIVAWLVPIPKWKEQFELARLNPGAYDAHCALASEMYKVPIELVPKEDTDDQGNRTIRYTAKRCRHGLNYRMGPDRLSTTAGLPIREAEEAYRLYHRATPELQQWWDETMDEVRRNRCLYNAYGRRWQLLERLSDEALESIIAFKPQSTNGDHVSRCIYMCHDDPEWPPQARIILNIHDALVAINRHIDGPIVRAVMKRYAEAPIIIRGEPLIVPVDMAVSQPDENGVHRWSTLKKIKAGSSQSSESAQSGQAYGRGF